MLLVSNSPMAVEKPSLGSPQLPTLLSVERNFFIAKNGSSDTFYMFVFPPWW